MPNYYRNRLTVLHDSPERVEEVMAAIRSEERDVIDFNRIIPQPEPFRGKDHDGMAEAALKWMIDRAFPRILSPWDEEMAKRHGERTDDGRKEAEEGARQMLRNIADYGYASFLRWSIDNWGTKWNSIYGYDDRMWREGDTIHFGTANGYCKPVIEKLSQMFPDVGFEYAAADEDCGANTIKGVFRNGEFEGVEEHRTPLAFAICWELYPERKSEFHQMPDGTWEMNEEE